MRIFLGTRIWLTLAILAALALGSSAALAHEHREKGGYQFVVGFMNEPAYEGFQNGISLRVTRPATVDAHSHEEGAGHDGSEMAMIDVEEHGALFLSPTLAHDATYNLDIPHHWEGLTIPYHNHLDHVMTGSITVSDTADMSGGGDVMDVMIESGAFQPADITVRPGSTVVWTNHSEDPHIVTSGMMASDDHSHGEVEMAPVEGLESSLQVEVTHLPTGISKTLPLRAVWSDPGHYTADLLPTAPGPYRFRFLGTIDGTEIDESFESGPDTFNEVQAAEVLQFPEPVPAVREVEGAVRGAQTAAQEAQDSAVSANSKASSASTLAIIGIVLGVVGIVSGIGGVAMGMRKR